MIRKTIIEIKWSDEGRNDLTHDDRDEMYWDGIDRAVEMGKQGYREGELVTEYRNEQIRGWWKIQEVEHDC